VYYRMKRSASLSRCRSGQRSGGETSPRSEEVVNSQELWSEGAAFAVCLHLPFLPSTSGVPSLLAFSAKGGSEPALNCALPTSVACVLVMLGEVLVVKGRCRLDHWNCALSDYVHVPHGVNFTPKQRFARTVPY